MPEHDDSGTWSEPAWREALRRENAIATINKARRRVMNLCGGNLDHPALDHLEAAIGAIEATTESGSSSSTEQETP